MEIRENVSLKKYSTFKIGGAAKFFCVIETLDELQKIVEWARENGQKIFVLGGGSNVLFPDEGWNGIVVKIENKELELKSDGKNIDPKLKNSHLPSPIFHLSCDAGVSLAKLVDFAAENSLAGLEWAAGIPGMVGGAVRGNAGAYGGSVADSLLSVEIVNINEEIGRKRQDATNSKFQIPNFKSNPKSKIKNVESENLNLRTFLNKKCEFGYRSSLFKKNKDLIVWNCIFELKSGNKEEIKNKVEEIKKIRSEKHPNLKEFPSCGSFFQNPVAPKDVVEKFEKEKNIQSKGGKVPAGWLIEEAGLKGFGVGGAQVSNKQANFIVNTKEATQRDVLMLASIIKEKVRNKFRVQLKEEVEIVY